MKEILNRWNHDRMEQIAARQAEIEQLKAENIASLERNSGLEYAARLDQVRINELTASNESLEALVGQLKEAQRQIELLNHDQLIRNAALEVANKELESFSYAISHDLRSPLRSIHGFSEALRQSASSKLSPEELAWLQKVSDAAARMDRLTEDLLRLSRVARSQIKRVPVNLTLIAREVVHELRQFEPQRDVVFAISDSLETWADPVLMRVAVSNLLENAWKYTSKTEQAMISFEREQRDGQTVFCIRDNGAGFDMTYASKLFTPFQRLHSAREFPGSGVGLACVARVIHKHGGRIWADARTGEGAAFYFTIGQKFAPAEIETD